MVKVLYTTLSPALKAAADREGRHVGKFVYGTKKAANDARAAQAANKVPKAVRPSALKKKTPNTSAIFWSNYPGPRENVDHVSVFTGTPSQFLDLRVVLPITSESTRAGFRAFTPAFPDVMELTGLSIKFHCGLLHRDVKVQCLVILAKTVADADALDWDTVAALPKARWYQDIQSVEASYKLAIDRPVNTGAEADVATFVAMFRAIDSDPESDAHITVTVTATASQLKAGGPSLDL